jgi:FAD/FMN-containing dehydrogenase
VTTAPQGDIALEFTWVDAAGNVRVCDRYSEEGKGLAGGVGLIGIITEIKLQLTPPTNTKAISKNLLPDGKIADDVARFLKVGGTDTATMYYQ